MLTPKPITQELNILLDRLHNNTALYAGYPPNTDFDYSPLFAALQYPINNLGDAFAMCNPFSTHDYEYRVIEWFLKLYGLTTDNGWGYVTSCGTEGVLFGLWLAREQMQQPIVYFSNYGHYSIPKAINILHLEHRCIQTDTLGEIDYADFEHQLITQRDVIIVATLGSTMTSSIDDISKLRAIAERKGCRIYVHADAAIDGMILPFVDTPLAYRLTDSIDSVSISGHKIMGSPMPCGVVLTHQHAVKWVKKYVDYVANHDATVSGSRNGFAALILWYAILQKGRTGFQQFVTAAIERARLYTEKLRAQNITSWRFPHAVTVVLDQQPAAFLAKWRIPTNHHYSTLTALPKLTMGMMDEIIEDLCLLRSCGQLSANPRRLIFPNADPLSVLD